MSMERYIRTIDRAIILVSLALGVWLSPWFLLLTAFVGEGL